MKVSLVSQWFPPEHAPIGYMIRELAEELARHGHEVTVVTGFPNHPTGVVFPGYTKSWLQQERVGGVGVLRTWLFTSSSRSRLSRALTFLTFTVTSCLVLLRKSRPDVVFAVFQPLTVALTLALVARVRRCRLVLNVQDLHPDALVSMGVLRNRVVIWLLHRLEAFGYRHADGLVVICDGFRDHAVARGARRDRVTVIANWIDTDAVTPGERDNEMRAVLGVSTQTFVVLYAGTIGHASGAHVVLEAAERLRDQPDIRVAFVGDGPVVASLRSAAGGRGLSNVVFLPFQARERLSLVQACADVAVVTLRPGHGRLSVPSKVLGYMAGGRAVIASVDPTSETARLVDSARCGVVVPAGDASALARAILTLRDEPRRRRELADNGRDYAVKHCSRDVATRRYVDFLSSAATW